MLYFSGSKFGKTLPAPRRNRNKIRELSDRPDKSDGCKELNQKYVQSNARSYPNEHQMLEDFD